MQLAGNISYIQPFSRPKLFAGFPNEGGYAHGIRVVPEGISGRYEVKDSHNGLYGFQVLLEDGRTVDNNDPSALGRHREFIMTANGSVLTGRTGLGGFLYRILLKSNVDFVTVAEPDLDILRLIEPVFSDFSKKLMFVNCPVADVVNRHVYDVVYCSF